MAVFRVLQADAAAACAAFALSAATTAAGVAVVTAADAAGVSVAGLSLAAVGALALWGASGAAVRRRADDVAIARLRGVDGPRLVWVAVAPLLLVVVLGLLVGTLGGALAGQALARSWDVAATLPPSLLLVPAALLLGTLAVVVGTARRLRARPLATALVGAVRPTPPSVLARFGQLSIVVVAVVALRQAIVSRGWWVDVAVVAGALAGGQLVAWAVPAVAARVRRGRTLPGLLLARRLRRAGADTGLLRLVVAALVVLTVAVALVSAGRDWRDNTARLMVGAPVRYDAAGPVAAYAATTRADPDGHYLMAAAWDTDPRDPRVFVDRSRWAAVAGDFLPDLPIAAPGGDAHFFTGSLDLEVASADRVTLTWVDQHNYLQSKTWRVAGRATVTIPDCADGCALASATPLYVTVRSGGHVLATGGPKSWPVVTTAPVHTVEGPDGTDHPAAPVITADGLPIIGTGVLADLATALGGSGAPGTSIRAAVLARADTPPSVLAAAGLTGPGTRLPETRAGLDQQRAARASTLALVAAAGSGLAGLVLLLQIAWGLRRERRTEVAALRAAGLSRWTVNRAHWLEALTLAAVAAVGATVTTAIVTALLGARLVPAEGWTPAPAPHGGVPWSLAGLAAAAAFVLVMLLWRSGLRSALAAGRPSTLRGSER